MNTKSFNIGLLRFSKEFFEAASQLRGAEETLSPTPVYYLYAHSIELAMKAYLVTEGYSEQQLHKIGHDLKKTWDKSKALNISNHLNNPMEIEKTIGIISPYYNAKELEYIVEGYKQLPKIIDMHNSAKQLINGIGKFIHNNITI
jgi:hypothetical protein